MMTPLLAFLLFLSPFIITGIIIGLVEKPEIYTTIWRKVTGRFLGKRLFGVTYNKVDGLSGRARQILRFHHTLPESHRLDVDLIGVLRSYDLKNGGVAKVEKHFSSYIGGCYCSSATRDGVRISNCPMDDYEVLHDSIREIANAVREQKAELERLAVAGVVNNMPLLIERAREEAQIVKEATKELSQW